MSSRSQPFIRPAVNTKPMGPARTAILLLVVAGTVWIGVGLTTDTGFDAQPIDDRLVRPIENGSAIWPYTSRSRSIAGRTLALNLVVVGDPSPVNRLLTNRTAVDWEPAGNDTRARIGAGGIDWQAARGAARYTYVRPSNGGGHWKLADYQLATGPYLGSRVHIRAYVSPDREWTALQAHEEYWDWFRLRHTVTGVASAGQFVESDLHDQPTVTRIDRLYHGFEGGGSDGRLTVVELTLGLVFLVAFGGRGPDRQIRRLASTGLPLVVALAGIVLGVRAAGMALEIAAPGIDPRLFAGILYPVLVVGPLVVVRTFADRHRPAAAFGLAVAGFGLGIAIDAVALGLLAPPGRLVGHRLVLAAALGTVAIGVATRNERGRTTVAVGVIAWTGALIAPLLGLV